MSRTKGGFVTRRQHKKVLKLTKGHWGSRHRLFRRANESMLHALWYSFIGRKQRTRNLRSLWIARINAAARMHDISYSRLIAALKVANIQLDRKSLADLAVHDPQSFAAVVSVAKQAAS
ncbi:MAG: 50S ribosomal protein L20 [Anaerolineae bacterium]|nr:50S ribosomal protein L20 [Anaerolineae bacterium]